jgi:hypothetical protein
MTVRAVAIARNLQLPAAVGVQFTGPVNTATIIKRAVFTNTSAGARTITAHVVPSGSTVSNATMLINGQSLSIPPGAGSSYVAPELAGVVLSGGDTLQCFADAAAGVTMSVNGIQQS